MNRSFVWPPFLTRSLSLSHTLLQMLLKWLFFSLCIMPAMFSNTRRKCPTECNCSFDELDRYQAICTKGKWRNKCEKRTIKRTSNYRARTRKKRKEEIVPEPDTQHGQRKMCANYAIQLSEHELRVVQSIVGGGQGACQRVVRITS